MKLHPLTPLLAPPLWSYFSGFAFGSLASVLGSENAELVTASMRVVVFALAFPAIGWLVQKTSEPIQDITVRDWDAKRESVTQELREARQFAQTMRASRNQYELTVGRHKYILPSGITPAHLLALSEVVGRGEPPTDRALVPPFARGKGETFQTFRDWMVYEAGEKAGELAKFRTNRQDYNLTPLGVVMLHQWMIRLYPPSQCLPAVKKVLITLSKAMRERTSKQKERAEDEVTQ